MKTNPGELAYPFQAQNSEDMCSPDWGLTKREWAYFTLLAGLCAGTTSWSFGTPHEQRKQEIVQLALEITDAAFAKLNAQKEPTPDE